MQVSPYADYSKYSVLNNVSMSMIKKSADMQSVSLDKIMSSVEAVGSTSAAIRPGIGERINTYA